MTPKRSRLMCSLAVLAASTAFAAAAHGQVNYTPHTAMPASPALQLSGTGIANVPVTLNMQSFPTISKTTAELGKKYNLNIVTDALPDDNGAIIQLNNVPLQDALQTIAKSYAREVRIVNGVIVFRAQNWFLLKNRKNLPFGFRSGPPIWYQEGTADVRYSQGSSKVQPILAVSALNSPLPQLLQKFSDATASLVAVPEARRDDRLSATLTKATPAQFLDAVTYLLNSRQIVTIDQTNTERDAEKKLVAASTYDHKSEREKRSDVLRVELMPLLTTGQKATIEKGKEVPLQVDSLPADIQRDVMAFIEFVYQTHGGHQTPLDASKLAIVFLPVGNAPGGSFGVNSYAPNGSISGF